MSVPAKPIRRKGTYEKIAQYDLAAGPIFENHQLLLFDPILHVTS